MASWDGWHTNDEENIAMTVEALNTRELDYPVGTSYAFGPVEASELMKRD